VGVGRKVSIENFRERKDWKMTVVKERRLTSQTTILKRPSFVTHMIKEEFTCWTIYLDDTGKMGR
jgi:hypothetical protein